MVTSVTNKQVSKSGHDYTYYDYFGLSTDSKPTTGVFNGSSFLEKVVNAQGVFQNRWRIYIFDATNMDWSKFAEWTV